MSVPGDIFATTHWTVVLAERALAKNGSWLAYLFSAALLAAYCASLLGIAGGTIRLLLQKWSRSKTPVSASNPAVVS